MPQHGDCGCARWKYGPTSPPSTLGTHNHNVLPLIKQGCENTQNSGRLSHPGRIAIWDLCHSMVIVDVRGGNMGRQAHQAHLAPTTTTFDFDGHCHHSSFSRWFNSASRPLQPTSTETLQASTGSYRYVSEDTTTQHLSGVLQAPWAPAMGRQESALDPDPNAGLFQTALFSPNSEVYSV